MCSEELGGVQAKVQAKVVHRTARVGLRTTRGQRRRCFSLLRSGGDVRAWVLDANRARHQAGQAALTNYQALCRELTARGPANFGELGSVGARSVLRRYTSEWHSAAQRRKKGEKVGFPRRKKALVPIRYYHGTFAISHGRLRLPTARGTPPLELRLGRDLPYDKDQVRSVTLVAEAGRLFVDVTAHVAVEPCKADPAVVAGVDLGIIHPYALASGEEALVVSGRAIRAEERLRLADTKARSAHMGRKAPRRGQRGSRRWRQLRRTQRQAEACHRRRVRHVHHQAAKQVVSWAQEKGVGTLVIGDPKGITTRDVGHRQNLRLRQWRRTHLLQALVDKASLAGMAVKLVDERGTSSTCPACGHRVVAKGRRFGCSSCGFEGHRDVVGAQNIAARGGGSTSTMLLVTHRRAGKAPARRDRRRHLWDEHRSCLARGRPGSSGSRSSGRRRDGTPSAATAPRADSPAPGEEPQRLVQPGKR